MVTASGAYYTSLALSASGAVESSAGTSWGVVGTAGFSASGAHYTSLALDTRQRRPVRTAYQDSANSDKATVQQSS